MSPRPQIHRRIQEQRLIFHFNSIATQSQPCEQRQPALRVPSETIKRLKRSRSIYDTTTVEFGLVASSCWQTKTRGGTNKRLQIKGKTIFWSCLLCAIHVEFRRRSFQFADLAIKEHLAVQSFECSIVCPHK